MINEVFDTPNGIVIETPENINLIYFNLNHNDCDPMQELYPLEVLHSFIKTKLFRIVNTILGKEIMNVEFDMDSKVNGRKNLHSVAQVAYMLKNGELKLEINPNQLILDLPLDDGTNYRLSINITAQQLYVDPYKIGMDYDLVYDLLYMCQQIDSFYHMQM